MKYQNKRRMADLAYQMHVFQNRNDLQPKPLGETDYRKWLRLEIERREREETTSYKN